MLYLRIFVNVYNWNLEVISILEMIVDTLLKSRKEASKNYAHKNWIQLCVALLHGNIQGKQFGPRHQGKYQTQSPAKTRKLDERDQVFRERTFDARQDGFCNSWDSFGIFSVNFAELGNTKGSTGQVDPGAGRKYGSNGLYQDGNWF